MSNVKGNIFLYPKWLYLTLKNSAIHTKYCLSVVFMLVFSWLSINYHVKLLSCYIKSCSFLWLLHSKLQNVFHARIPVKGPILLSKKLHFKFWIQWPYCFSLLEIIAWVNFCFRLWILKSFFPVKKFRKDRDGYKHIKIQMAYAMHVLRLNNMCSINLRLTYLNR